MAIVGSYVATLLILLSLILFYGLLSRGWKKSSVPTNWPVIGMMPALLQNTHRVHEFITEILEEVGGTFEFKGPWFSNLDMVITGDPPNVHHILSRNFSNYPKGPEFRRMFDILGNGVFNADSELWEIHRKITMSLVNQANFQRLLQRTVWQKVEKGLLPVLDNFAQRGDEVDLQDIFQRFTFDSISKLVLDHDPSSLAIEFPDIPSEKAFNDVMEAILYRNILPESCWKLQKLFGIGKEKKLSRAWDAFDEFIYPCIARKEEELSVSTKTKKVEGDELDCLSALMEAYQDKASGAFGDAKLLLRDALLNLMLAGRDTTSTALTWLFWLLSTNPSVEIKILEEIRTQLHLKEDDKWRYFNAEESRKLVYLHGALCEALRLFPPVALEHKIPVKSDMFPCGLHVEANTRLILSFYSMGRMESVWGKDRMEFKPERWISERGGIKHQPSYKFPAFNAGPRTCLGKDMSFIQMKMVAATIVYNYRIQMVEAHPIAPRDSIILQMKCGFMVRLEARN